LLKVPVFIVDVPTAIVAYEWLKGAASASTTCRPCAMLCSTTTMPPDEKLFHFGFDFGL